MLGAGLYNKFGKEYKPGEIIFSEFEPGNDFYLIQSGRVKITKIVKDKEKTMDVLETGDMFGEMAILEEQPRSASAIAMDNVSLLHFNRENFVSLMTSQPQLALKLLVVFSRRIYDARRRVMILLLDDPQAKVADVILMLSEKEANHKDLSEITLMVSVEDIANWCAEPVAKIQEVISGYIKNQKMELYPDKLVVHNLRDLRRIVEIKRKSRSL